MKEKRSDFNSVSIIIRTRNEVEHIERLIVGIKKQSIKDVEIIVVDSGSTDGTLNAISNFEDIKIVHIKPSEFTYGRALNLGCEVATKTILCFASAHTYPLHEDWLKNLIKPFEDRLVALTYGMQRGDERSAPSEISLFKELFPESEQNALPAPFCNNANSAVRRSLWVNQKFDESLPGLEDLVWANEIILKGFKIKYVPDAAIAHIHQENTRQIYNRFFREAKAFQKVYPEQRITFNEFLIELGASIRKDLANGVSLIDSIKFQSIAHFGAFSGINLAQLNSNSKLRYPFTLSKRPKGQSSHVAQNTNVLKFQKREFSNESITAIVPMRHNSERVPFKNFRNFNGKPLFFYIVETLKKSKHIGEIIIDTDSPTIMEMCEKSFSDVRVLMRPEHLREGSIPMNTIISNILKQTSAKYFLQTHSTNPLLRAETIDGAFEHFMANKEKYDSVFSALEFRARFWNKDAKPLNHDLKFLKRTQDLDPIYLESSSFYFFTRDSFNNTQNRIGERPLMYVIDEIEATDIDIESEFKKAEILHQLLQQKDIKKNAA